MRHFLTRLRCRALARSGFTLIETLVAFAILALALGALLELIGGGARNEAYAEFLAAARRDAQSHLAALGESLPLTPGQTSGVYDDGLRWTLRAEPHWIGVGRSGVDRVRGYYVELTVLRPSTGGATFSTLKLVVEKAAMQ